MALSPHLPPPGHARSPRPQPGFAFLVGFAFAAVQPAAAGPFEPFPACPDHDVVEAVVVHVADAGHAFPGVGSTFTMHDPPYHDQGEVDEGGAWLYLGSPAGPDTAADWQAEGNLTNALMGYDVAAAGNVNGDAYDDVVVGLLGRNRAHVYMGSAVGLPANPSWIAFGGWFFGGAVGSAGDVNGDGFDDVIIGAANDGADQPWEGRASLFLGSPGGLSPTAAWVREGDQDSCRFGFSVGSAGDVNGDGFDDVIVGAPDYNNGEVYEGRAFVFHGSPAGLETMPAWTAESDQPDTYFGFSVGSAGDVNGDTYDDVIVGATWWSQGVNADDGEAVVFLGSPTGLAPTPAWTTYGNNAELGYSVAGAGDVNLDGYADVLVGAPHYHSSEEYEGAALLFLGSPAGPAPNPDWIGELNLDSAHLGQAVAGAGDVNGDGSPDVILGAPYSHCPVYSPCGPIPAFATIYHSIGTTGIEAVDSPRAPVLRLGEPRPNPFASSSAIPFTLATAARVRLVITDALGREVAVLGDGPWVAGRHVVSWDGRNVRREKLGSGVYFLRLTGEDETAVQRLVLVH